MGELRTTSTDANAKVGSVSNTKKAALILLSIAVLGTGGTATYMSRNNVKTPEETTTGGENHGNDSENGTEDTFTVEHLLNKPFDINNDADVNALIEAIESATGTKIDDLLLKYYNYASLNKENVITKEDFGKVSDEAIAEIVGNYALTVFDAYNDGIAEYVQIKAHNMVGKDATPYVKKLTDTKKDVNRLSPFTMIDKNSYVYKTYQQDFDKLLDKELSDIIAGNTDEYEKNAIEFLDQVTKIVKDKQIDLGQKAVIFEGFKAIHPLFSGILDKVRTQDNEFLKKEIENNSLNANYGKLLENFGVYVDIEACEKAKEEYEKRVASDQAKAEQIIGDAYEVSTTTKSGGSHQSNNHETSSEKASEGTTAKPTTTTREASTTKHQETTTKKKGGDVVDESSTVGTTRKIDEEDVAPGEEPEENSYSDADAIGAFLNLGPVFRLFRR